MHPALVHENDAGADVARKFHFMRYHQQRHAFASQFTHDREHLRDQLGIERRGDLVAEKRDRLHGECTGNGNALLLTTGQFIGIGIELMRQPDPFQHVAGNGFCFRFRCLLHHRLRQHDVAADRLVRKEVELLEDHADLQPQSFQMQIIVEKLRAGD